ncbi:MAG TPA: penicillin-binding transpeptidase domain-containing protein [Candidatus Sumerlaeota bacterium]|nr:penicillin-binding transpeptidase domain-containing protein [Candidatus Sumerlaeota bacterium]
MKLRKPHRLRVVILGALFCGLTLAVGVRLYALQQAEHDHYMDRANRQHLKRVVIQPERGDILDRNGNYLAQSTGRLTLYVDPKYFTADKLKADHDAMIQTLVRTGSLEPAAVRKALAAKSPTALAKRVRSETANQLMDVLDSFDVDARGFWLHRESTRLYPRHLAPQVIGYCSTDGDGDNDGIAGIELSYNDKLKGEKIVGSSSRTAISETLRPWEQDDLLAARGKTLVLTLDAKIQESVEESLARHVQKHEAASGGVIVMDTNSGAILAMASYPTFDNNKFGTATPEGMRNRNLTDPLETGSVAKLFTAAMLIEDGLATPETVVDCEGGFAIVDGRRVKDAPGHVLHVATFREVLRWSSNVGIVKLAQVAENKRWYEFFKELNIGSPTGIDLPGEGSGIFYPLERWTKFTRTSLPQGYEMALTPLQITAGMSAVVNGGNYYKPYIVAEIRDPKTNTSVVTKPTVLRNIVRPTTSALLRSMMEDIVDNGTGEKAQIAGYRIGGKTGTTRKSHIFDRREYIASFVGVLPIQAPRVTVYLYVDAPKKEYYASSVAAPLFNDVAKAVTVNLGIPPTEEIPEPEEVSAKSSKGRKNELDMVQPPVGEIRSGGMPEFNGMTMLQARQILPSSVSKVKFLGTGFVTDQFPRPGDPLTENTEIVLHFSQEKKVAEMTEQNSKKVAKGQ